MTLDKFIKVIYTCFILIFITIVPTIARRSPKGPVKLTIYPAKAGELEKEFLLTVQAEDQIDADALPLYEKAVKSIPKNFNEEQITEWLKLPVEQFPQQKAEMTLQKYLESLKLVARATRCKECNWPEWKPGDQSQNLSEYRKLAYIIELWARLEISRRSYNGAIIAIRTGFEMARDLGQGRTIIHGLVGGAVGGIICRELELFIQQNDSPNLYHALVRLPNPFIDIEKAIEYERKVGLGSVKNKQLREQFDKQMASSLDRTRMTSKRLDNNINGLQCVEAIRHYVATHGGQLPDKLSEISEIEIPKDIVSGKEFEYRRTATGATLRSAIPKGGNERDTFNYVITLKK